MPAYYNEIDPYAAEWLRNLIKAGHIAPGEVDERSIVDVKPDDLRAFDQCHFFAGIGVWSLALRKAGWSDDHRIWTGSCPCQPFSAAGKGAGFDDERHLWPAWFHLITQCRPAIVVGEQVASRDADAWIDLVRSDMEGLGAAFGAVAFPSASVGAPHIRDRTYWVADAYESERQRFAGEGSRPDQASPERPFGEPSGHRYLGVVADSHDARSQGWSGMPERADQRAIGPLGVAGVLADADGRYTGTEREQRSGQYRQQPEDRKSLPLADDHNTGQRREQGLRIQRPNFHDADGRRPVGGFWSDADWIACRDGKWRPVESGTFPLAHGATSRVGRLRAYGNAVNASQAQIFIESLM